jgi:archaemetzincin
MRKPVAVPLLALLVLLPSTGCHRRIAAKATSGPEVERLKAAMEVVRPLYRPMGPVQFGDWLSIYPEHGQTFQEYLKSHPNIPRDRRRVLYVRVLGDVTPAQLRIVELTAEYLERFYGLPTLIATTLPIANVPAEFHRSNALLGTEQIKTVYLMDRLKRVLPDDAFAEIGLTASDLYPNEQMNFVFGQASLRDRVGVWSLHWLGEPDKNEAEFHAALVRTLKIASHEMGHMFSIPHCTKYKCAMNGANSLDEVDYRHPLDTCPECMAKICWATGTDPRQRLDRLAGFFARYAMDAERLPFERPLKALTDGKPQLAGAPVKNRTSETP